jgi:DNA mismatch endonuclease, patch repair protein
MNMQRPFKAVEKRLAGARHLLTTKVASERMAQIRQRGTAPELVVRRFLSSLGYRYSLKNKDLPGSPDLANRSKGWTIFVHGCYWHRHEGCSRATTPKSNVDFWLAKFFHNRRRDAAAAEALQQRGYSVCTLWECECNSAEQMSRILRPWLDKVVRN